MVVDPSTPPVLGVLPVLVAGARNPATAPLAEGTGICGIDGREAQRVRAIRLHEGRHRQRPGGQIARRQAGAHVAREVNSTNESSSSTVVWSANTPNKVDSDDGLGDIDSSLRPTMATSAC